MFSIFLPAFSFFAAAPPPSARLVVPGKSVGFVRVAENMDDVFRRLGKPDLSDAAMGKSSNTWISGLNRLDIFAARQMGIGQEISRARQIRVTSKYFKTASGLGPGGRTENFRQAFPSAKRVAFYPSNTGRVDVYDSRRRGLAWEARHGRCVAVVIHKPGASVLDSYLPYAAHLSRVSERVE